MATTPEARLDFFDVLVHTEITLWAAVDRATMTAAGLPLGNVTVMRAVHRGKGLARVQELADWVGITVGAVSKIVDKLEAAGLVSRRPHPTDRRSTLIAMSAKGESALDSALEAMLAELGSRTDILSASALQATTNRLAKLSTGFGRPPGS